MEKKIVKIVCECAKIYDENLKGKNIMFIFENQINKKIEYLETEFLANNFRHLTGIKCKNEKTSIEFYKMCLNNKLSYKDIVQKQNGTTRLKLEILPQLVNIGRNAKLIADYDNSKINLYTEKIIGNIRCCVGFVKKDKYYLPNTIIKQDVREISQKQSINKIIAILEKSIKDKQYNCVTYIKKDIDLFSIIKVLNIQERVKLL